MKILDKFNPYSELYLRFKNDYLKLYKQKGFLEPLVKKYGISVTSIRRLIKENKLPSLFDPNHPGILKFNKSVVNLYHNKNYSIRYISKKYGVSSNRVKSILERKGITDFNKHNSFSLMRRNHPRISSFTHFEQDLKNTYEQQGNLTETANRLGFDPHFLSIRLKELGYHIKPAVKWSGYITCLWCGDKTKRKSQHHKYCSTSCSNKAKDLRAGKRKNIQDLYNELKSNHPQDYNIAVEKIINSKKPKYLK